MTLSDAPITVIFYGAWGGFAKLSVEPNGLADRHQRGVQMLERPFSDHRSGQTKGLKSRHSRGGRGAIHSECCRHRRRSSFYQPLTSRKYPMRKKEDQIREGSDCWVLDTCVVWNRLACSEPTPTNPRHGICEPGSNPGCRQGIEAVCSL